MVDTDLEVSKCSNIFQGQENLHIARRLIIKVPIEKISKYRFRFIHLNVQSIINKVSMIKRVLK